MSKYVDYICGPCNLADDIEVRHMPVRYAGLEGAAAVEVLRERCCGMPCRNWIENTFGFPMLEMDYNFYRTNGRLPGPDDRERLMNLRNAKAKRDGTTADLRDFLDEDGNVWGYDQDVEVPDPFADTRVEVTVPADNGSEPDEEQVSSRWSGVPKKRKTGKVGRPSEIEVEFSDDFVLDL